MEDRLLSQEIDDNEFLYRGITYLHWDPIEEHISSAAFKPKNGLSVDRDAGRDKSACVNRLVDSSDFVLVTRVLTQSVRSVGMCPKYLPVDGNCYHSEIHRTRDIIKLTDGQSKRLRDMSEIVYNKDSDN